MPIALVIPNHESKIEKRAILKVLVVQTRSKRERIGRFSTLNNSYLARRTQLIITLVAITPLAKKSLILL